MNLASPSCSLISSIDLLLFAVESASDESQNRPCPSDERIKKLHEFCKFTKNLQDSCKNIS